MRIGIDVDGVLTDVEQWQLDYGSKFYYHFNNKTIANYKGYETREIFSTSAKEDMIWWQQDIEAYSKEPARKFADEVIHKLKEDGHELIIITARCADLRYTDITTKQMQEIVKKWLKEYNIYYDKIIFSPEDKLKICIEEKIDIMIEDKPANIRKISTKIPVICYHANYNEKCQGESIYRAYSWYDIYHKITNVIANKQITKINNNLKSFILNFIRHKKEV